MEDYYDITYWSNKPTKYLDYFVSKDKQKLNTKSISPLEIDVVKLYGLLKCKVSLKPNGIYTFFQKGLPLDNIIWWDYVLESDKGFIHIWRTSHIVEVLYFVDDEKFDFKKFIHSNISKYIDEILKVKESFETHTLFINHYESYKNCVEFLWEEISNLDLQVPPTPQKHVIEEKDFENYSTKLENFGKTSVKFHTLGKSLILNSAFKIESFLNLIIRIGASKELKKYPDILKKHLNNSFSERLKNLKYYSIVIKSDVDLDNQAIKDANDLMTLRNKYVHFDENSIHNKIGLTYFDEMFPLHPVTKNPPAIDFYMQAFHRPDYSTVEKSYNTSCNFVNYIESILIDEYRSDIMHLARQNPIGYNETKQMYSSVSSPNAIDFYMTMKK